MVELHISLTATKNVPAILKYIAELIHNYGGEGSITIQIEIKEK